MLTMQLSLLCRRASLSLPPMPIAYPKQCLLQNHSMDSLSTWQSRNYSECDLSSVTPTAHPPPSLPRPPPRQERYLVLAPHVTVSFLEYRVVWLLKEYPGYQRFFSRAAGIFGVGRSHERRSARVTIMTWQKPETALEKSLTPMVLKELIKFAISHLCNPSIYNY